MLKTLSIRDIVLIDRLDLAFASGLCVLTGETGAGKSILLDSLGLALGGRAERALVRAGTERGSVIAVFEPGPNHPAWARLAEQGYDCAAEGGLILRRVIEADGRSRAFINDYPVGVALLKEIGDMLVEIHGQHDDRGLLNSGGHRRLLDAFGLLDAPLAAVRAAHGEWRALVDAAAAEDAALAAIRADEDYLRHVVAELDDLAPEAGEEEILATRRSAMMQSDKIRSAIGEVLGDLQSDGGADAGLRGAMRRLERITEPEGASLDPVLGALERASTEAGEAIGLLEDFLSGLDFDPRVQEATEERLFALRGAARKHQCAVDDLPAVRDNLSARLAALDAGEGELQRLTVAAKAALGVFREKVLLLRAAREAAAAGFDAAVNAELAPLRLEKAKIRIRLDLLDESGWTADGGERVEFEVATNPGAPFGPLMKIASGGEQSLFILALKVVLARQGSAPTLVFDEVDRGVGGAVADAVGERLARLAEAAQVLVVTHSPQVAAAGCHHWQIRKAVRDVAVSEEMVTLVTPLDQGERQEEIARMLAGARVTDEARAAAAQLMQR